MPPPAYILVSGPPRSGTTMLQHILCGPHTALKLPECSFITRAIEHYSNIVRYSDAQRFDAYFGSRERAREIYSNIIKILLSYAEQTYNPANKTLILKDPELSLFLHYATELFPPTTRVVLSIRNPLAVIASIKQVTKRSGKNFDLLEASRQIFTYYYEIWQFKASNETKNVMFVKYEEIASRRQETLEELRDFCGYELNLQGDRTTTYDPSDPFYSPLSGKPVTDEAVAEWQRILNSKEINSILKDFAGVMENWGYAPSST